MSRVYDALKKAEREHAENRRPNGTLSPVADAVKPSARETETLWSLPDLADSGQPQAEAETGVPEPALYSAAASSGPRLVVGGAQYCAASEQFHLLSLSLSNEAAEQGHRIFAITSALSGEGKSFVAINLAASLARLGNRVLLVDADLRTPTLHHALDLRATQNLTDYLTGKADFGACLHATPIPNLLLVPAARASEAATEMLAGPRMREFVAEARAMDPARYVIIDSPAATLVPEPQILGRLADALVVVVAANRTPRQLVRQALDNAAGVTVFGIVLNRFEPPYSTVSQYPEGYAHSLNSA